LSAGCTRFELVGRFDSSIEDLDPHWFWLLFGKNDLCATMQSLDRETQTAVLTCDVKDEPKVAGESLAYLSPRWQAYHVWMILGSAWGWERKRFHGANAVAEDYDVGETSVVEGRDDAVLEAPHGSLDLAPPKCSSFFAVRSS